MLKSKFMRWILLLPAAFAVAFLAQRLTKLISAWQMGHGVLGTLLIEMGSGAMLGAVFVLTGLAMAP
jgi:H+/gluconate symporter-like permease